MIDRESLIVQHEGWLSASIQEDLVMMSMENDFYLSLHGCGERIWQLLASPRCVNEICNILAIEYVIDPCTAEPEVISFLEQLCAQKAIDVLPATTD